MSDEQDAKRYRWIRDQKCAPFSEAGSDWDDLDASVDQAMVFESMTPDQRRDHISAKTGWGHH